VARGNRSIAARSSANSYVGKLAEFLDDAMAMRIPVRVSISGPGGHPLFENTVIEFGTAAEVLFSCTLPLEFDDRVRLQNADRSLDTEGTVVAVQYHDGSKAVAVRFLVKPGNWIIQR
jgi:hypothetical protein